MLQGEPEEVEESELEEVEPALQSEIELQVSLYSTHCVLPN